MLSLVGELKKVSPERKMLTKIKMMILLENATRDIESPGTCIRKARGRNHTKWIIQPITLDILLVLEVLKCHLLLFSHPYRMYLIFPKNRLFLTCTNLANLNSFT